MAWRLKLVPSPSHFNFMRWRHVGFFASAVLTLVSLVLVLTLGLNLGIDLKGGLMIEARTAGLMPRLRPSSLMWTIRSSADATCWRGRASASTCR